MYKITIQPASCPRLCSPGCGGRAGTRCCLLRRVKLGMPLSSCRQSRQTRVQGDQARRRGTANFKDGCAARTPGGGTLRPPAPSRRSERPAEEGGGGGRRADCRIDVVPHGAAGGGPAAPGTDEHLAPRDGVRSRCRAHGVGKRASEGPGGMRGERARGIAACGGSSAGALGACRGGRLPTLSGGAPRLAASTRRQPGCGRRRATSAAARRRLLRRACPDSTGAAAPCQG